VGAVRCLRHASAPTDIIVAPGPGLEPSADDHSWVTAALTRPHQLLEPLRPADAHAPA